MRLVRLQGWYYLLGGLWPFVHFPSFEAVAGPKPDRFQTEVSSVLFAAAGAGLLAGTGDQRDSRSVRFLAVASALSLCWMDLRYRRDLRAVFRADAALEALFAVAALRSGGKAR